MDHKPVCKNHPDRGGGENVLIVLWLFVTIESEINSEIMLFVN